MPASRMEILKLYKLLLRESSKFPTYNFREYAVTRVKDAFRTNKCMTDPTAVEAQLSKGYRNLELIKRQVVIGQLFGTDRLIIEKPSQ